MTDRSSTSSAKMLVAGGPRIQLIPLYKYVITIKPNLMPAVDKNTEYAVSVW